MEVLPNDIIKMIISISSPLSALSLMRTCKRFASLRNKNMLVHAKLLFYAQHEKRMNKAIAANAVTPIRHGEERCPDCKQIFPYAGGRLRHFPHQGCIAFSKPLHMKRKKGSYPDNVINCQICGKSDGYPCFWRELRHITSLELTCRICNKLVTVKGDLIWQGCFKCGIICRVCCKLAEGWLEQSKKELTITMLLVDDGPL